VCNMQLFQQAEQQEILKDVYLLQGFALPDETTLLAELDAVLSKAPLRQMVTPGGLPMSVTTSSCGLLGWISDRKGYRYSTIDPVNGLNWPLMPPSFDTLARSAAALCGFDNFQPDACLINHYQIGTKMGLHQDKDEQDFSQPIVSVSLGVPAIFQMGGLQRNDKVFKLALQHGDVLVWGGESRLRFHGVLPVKTATHPVLGACRVNLTFRKAGI